MTTIGSDHYAVLGIDRSASNAEVKAAYVRLIRTHTPESDPDTFRLVSDAYRVLSNPERRRAYDAEERIPPAVRARIDAIMENADEHPENAAAALARLSADHPSLRIIRFMQGVMHDRAEDHDASVRVFEKLFEEDPTDAVYATWLGDALICAGQSSRGVATLKEAIVLDPEDNNAYLCLARYLQGEGRSQEAVAIIEKAMFADGQVDVQDLPLFIELILIHASAQDFDSLDRSIRRMYQSVKNEDAEVQQYVAARLFPVLQLFDGASRPDLVAGPCRVDLKSRVCRFLRFSLASPSPDGSHPIRGRQGGGPAAGVGATDRGGRARSV